MKTKIKIIALRVTMFVLTFMLTVCEASALDGVKSIKESLEAEESPVDFMEFFNNELFLGEQWWLWLAIVVTLCVIVVVGWRYGHCFLRWYRGRAFLSKIAIAFSLLLLVSVVGCLKVGLLNSVGFWFTIPVTFSLMMLYLVIYDICRYIKRTCQVRQNGQKRDGSKILSTSSVGRQLNMKLLAKIVLLVWGLGWMLYFIPVNAVHGSHVGAEALFHPAACAMQMFAFHMDSFVVDANMFNGYEVVKGLISVVSFLAAICTTLALIGLVASRLMAYLHVKHFKIDDEYNHLYVFFGINDASTLLAKDILDEEHGDPHAKVVFVETSLAGEAVQKSETDGWKSILSMFTHHRKTFVSAQEGDRRALAISSANIASLDITNKIHDVWGSIGLKSIKRMLDDEYGLGRLRGAGKLYLFFLSEDRQENVLGATNVTHDALLKDAIEGDNHKFSIDIYCHVADFRTGRMLKDAVVNKKMNMHILNYSLLAIEGLKRDIKNQPISFVDVEPLGSRNPGTVSSSFVSLVIGFGETGQQALKFLYEYGAFPSNQSSANKSFRSEFVCHVVDKDMDSRVGAFHATRPAVPCVHVDAERDGKETDISRLATRLKDANIPNAPVIKFFSYDYKSVGFYDKALLPIVDSLNYVVVALGDAHANMSVAIDVLRYVRRHRPNLDNFKIFVRGYEKGSFDFINAIGERYNKLINFGNEDAANKKMIEIFGSNEMICNYDLFIQDQYLKEAKEYLAAYNDLHGYGLEDEFAHLDAWDARHVKTLGEYGDFSWSKLSELRRKEGQDRSNAVHAKTKLEILRRVLGDDNAMEKLKDIAMRMFVTQDGKVVESTLIGDMAKIIYPNLTEEENKLLLNIAITEHLRWVASHEMMGYTVNNSEHCCNEKSKQHNALRPWHELDKESPSYKVSNYGVLETTLKLRFFRNN